MNQTFINNEDKCKLVVNIVQSDSLTLKITYRFHNQSVLNAYLFNRTYNMINEQDVYVTNKNFVYIEQRKRRVLISKKIIAVPEDMDVEQPEIPCVTLINPKQTFGESLLLSLPLKVSTPYLEESELHNKPMEKEVWFEIGFFISTPEGDKLAKKVRTSEGPALLFYPFPVESQRIITVGPLSWKLPVLLPR